MPARLIITAATIKRTPIFCQRIDLGWRDGLPGLRPGEFSEEGVTDAMVGLAVMLHDGRGATQDSCEARRWLAKAAAMGSEPAKERLAKMALDSAA